MSLRNLLVLVMLLAFFSSASVTIGSDKFVYDYDADGVNVTLAGTVPNFGANLTVNVYLVNATNTTLLNSTEVTSDEDGNYITVVELTDENIGNSYYLAEALQVVGGVEYKESITFQILSALSYDFWFSSQSPISISDGAFTFKIKVFNQTDAIEGKNVSIEIVPSGSGIVLNSTSAVTGADGWTNEISANISNAAPGGYAIFANGGQGSGLFWVESFRTSLKILDEFGMPAKTFTANQNVRLVSKLTNINGNPINGNVEFILAFPSGEVTIINSNAIGNGVYTATFNLSNVPFGTYKITAKATVNNRTQTAFGSFDVSKYTMFARFVRAKEFNFISDHVVITGSTISLNLEIRNLANSSVHDAADTCSAVSGKFVSLTSTEDAVIETGVISGNCNVNATVPATQGDYIFEVAAEATVDGELTSFKSKVMVRVQNYIASLTPLNSVTGRYQPNFSPGESIVLQLSSFTKNSENILAFSNISNAEIINISLNGVGVNIPTYNYNSTTGKFNFTIPVDADTGTYIVFANVTFFDGNWTLAAGPMYISKLNVFVYTSTPSGEKISSFSANSSLMFNVIVTGSSGPIQGARVCTDSARDVLTGHITNFSVCGTTRADGAVTLNTTTSLTSGEYDLTLFVNYTGVIEQVSSQFSISNYPVQLHGVETNDFETVSHTFSKNELPTFAFLPFNVTNTSTSALTPYSIIDVKVNYFGPLNSLTMPTPIVATQTTINESSPCPFVDAPFTPFCKIAEVSKEDEWDPGVYSMTFTLNSSIGTQSATTYIIIKPFAFEVEQPEFTQSVYSAGSNVTLNATSEKYVTLSAILRDMDTLAIINNSLNINTSMPANNLVTIDIQLPDDDNLIGEKIIEITATNGTDESIEYIWVLVSPVIMTPIVPGWYIVPRYSRSTPEMLGWEGWDFGDIIPEAFDNATAHMSNFNLGKYYVIATNKTIFFDTDTNFTTGTTAYLPGSITDIDLGGANYTYVSSVTGLVTYTNTSCLLGNCTPSYDRFFGRYQVNTTVPIFVRIVLPDGNLLPIGPGWGYINVTVAEIKYMTGVMGGMETIPESDYSIVEGELNTDGWAKIEITTNRTGIFFVLLRAYFIDSVLGPQPDQQVFANPWDIFAFESIAYDGRTDIVQNIETYSISQSNSGFTSSQFTIQGTYTFNETIENYDLNGDNDTIDIFYFAWMHPIPLPAMTMVVIDDDKNMDNGWLTQPVMDNYTDVFLENRIYKITFENNNTKTIRLANLTFSWDDPMDPTHIFYQVEYLNGTVVPQLLGGNISIRNAETWEYLLFENLTQSRGYITVPEMENGEYLVWLEYTTQDGITTSHPRRLLKES